MAVVDEPLNAFLRSRGATDDDERRNAAVETYERLKRQLADPTAAPLKRPWGWIVVVARRCYIDERKRRARDEAAEAQHARLAERFLAGPGGQDVTGAVATAVGRAEWLAELQVVLRESVRAEEWQVLVDYYGSASANGRRDLAARLGVTGENLRQHIARLKKRLRSARIAFERRCPPPESVWEDEHNR
ncbi:MAG: hypothetical protein ACT4P6_09815 [Gemmatimonadaceae bacterium]